MSYTLIENKGEVDPMAFKLMGASTKTEDQEKIGEFGSGANYACAFLIRHNINFRIFAGEKEIEFTVVKKKIRDQEFDVLEVDGHETSFAIKMGYKWEAWWAIREFWCNALDEGDEKIDTRHKSEQIGEPGKTRIFIENTKEIQDVLDNWTQYFSYGRTDLLAEFDGVKIYRGGKDLTIYRRGIAVYRVKDTPIAYHYDFPNIDINESRQVSSTWELRRLMTRFWFEKADLKSLSQFVPNLHRNEPGIYEYNLVWGSTSFTISDAWNDFFLNKNVVEAEVAGFYQDYISSKTLILPSALVRNLVEQEIAVHVAGKMGGEGMVIRKPTKKETNMLIDAMKFLNESGYKVKYKIEVCDFTQEFVAGQAWEEKILLSERAFQSKKELVMTIVEENEHLKTGFLDNTREFQSHFIKLFVNEICERTGEYI